MQGELLSLSCLTEDIDYLIKNRITAQKHLQSATLLRKYVDNVIDDLSNLDDASIYNWQSLSHFVVLHESYEKCLSHFSHRFGAIDPKPKVAYHALDKLGDEIVERALLKKANFHNVVVCGGDPYLTNTGINLTCLRATDIHRLWNWGFLGHELGHNITRDYFPSITDAIPSRSRIRDGLSAEEVTESWVREIAADIFGTLVLGPAQLAAQMIVPRLWCFSSLDEADLIYFFSVHPPDEIRFRVMNETLGLMGLGGILDISDIVNIASTPGLDDCNKEDRERFKKRVEGIEMLISQMESSSKELCSKMRRKVNSFTPDNWKRSLEVKKYLEGEKIILPEDLLPSEILNGLLSVRQKIGYLHDERTIMRKTLKLFK